MKRPKLKKASKRLSCAKRYKIQKKVREHHKKVRKDAKKSGIRRKIKKDIGVPNSAPFKEEVLREAEQKKQELKELKEKNRLAKQKERAEKRKKGKDATTEPNSKRAKKDEKVKAQKKARAEVAKEKSTKKFRCSELNKVMEASDVIVEVLDARDPLGCRCPQLEEAVLNHSNKKKLLFVLNKIDLVPKDSLEKWLECLQAECPTILFKATTNVVERTVPQKRRRDSGASVDLSRAGLAFGRDCLLQTLQDLASERGDDSMLKVGVVGFPNVGKSSVINSLKGARVCCAGVQRGNTRCVQEVHISKDVKMIDSPAIVAAPWISAEKLTLRATEEERTVLEAAEILLKHCPQEHIMLQYNVPDYRNSLEFLTTLAKKRGYLGKGAVADPGQAATVLLNDWTGAKLSYYTKPPKKQELSSHLTEAMVTEMHASVNIERIDTANMQIIKRMRCPNQAFSICFDTKGLTDGLLSVSEIPEDKPASVEEGQEKEEEGQEKEEEGQEKEERQVEEEEGEANISEETEDPEGREEVETQSESKRRQPPKPLQQESTCKQMELQPVPVNTDVLVEQENEDDAYDFSTDFV